MEPVKFDKEQWKATLAIIFFLAILIFSHMPLACIGTLLIFALVTGRVRRLIAKTLHELQEGAINAIGLIIAALIIKSIPGAGEWFATHLKGVWVLVAAAISSPFTGAMVAPASDINEFYKVLTLIMLGAPLFVSSSLVAIVVFRDTIDYEHLPPLLKLFASKKQGVMQEALAYTVICVPLAIALGIPMYTIGVRMGLFSWFYGVIGG